MIQYKHFNSPCCAQFKLAPSVVLLGDTNYIFPSFIVLVLTGNVRLQYFSSFKEMFCLNQSPYLYISPFNWSWIIAYIRLRWTHFTLVDSLRQTQNLYTQKVAWFCGMYWFGRKHTLVISPDYNISPIWSKWNRSSYLWDHIDYITLRQDALFIIVIHDIDSGYEWSFPDFLPYLRS